jgi:Amt family ammonium transporter
MLRAQDAPARRATWIRLFASLAVCVCFASAALADESGVKVIKGGKIDGGETAWMLVSSALVLMMTGPGLALFYGGLVRRKNVLATMMQSFILMALFFA